MKSITHKRCPDCGETKPISEWYKNKYNSDGYHGHCKECTRKRARKYAHAHNDIRRTWARQYREQNRDEINEYLRNWSKKNNEESKEIKKRYRESHREELRLKNIEYSKKNKKKIKIKNKRYRKTLIGKRNHLIGQHRRRVKKLGNGGSFSNIEWERLCAKYDYKCLCCGRKKILTVDHIIPVILGGSNSIDNIQPLCRSCNCKKSTKIIDLRR